MPGRQLGRGIRERTCRLKSVPETSAHQWFSRSWSAWSTSGWVAFGGNYPRSPRRLLAYLGSHREPVLGVQPTDALGVHTPAFSSWHHDQPSIPEPHPARRQLSQPHQQRILWRSPAPVDQRLAGDFHQPRRPTPAQSADRLGPPPELTPPVRLQSFFCTISCRTCRSSERSATRRFIRRLKLLEEENRRLKQLVADLSLDKVMLQDVLRKKL
jgi:hypothetical protein